MKISRLDKIISNNVGFSAQRKIDEQTLFVLQDISETLAMIYDKLCGEDEIVDTPTVIPYEELQDYHTMHFEAVDYLEGYDVSYGGSYYQPTSDPLKAKECAILIAFNEKMNMPKSQYGKTWRCWTSKPTREESEKIKWEK